MVAVQTVSESSPRFGRYELLPPWSTCFFGTRFRARLADSGISGTHALGAGETGSVERRALRIVRAETSEIIERIAHAATSVRHAAHPALLSPAQIVREHGQLGIATLDVPGVTLRELVLRAMARDQGIPQAVALRIALDVLAGLHALDAALSAADGGVASYGGLTPDSILVGEDGQTRLVDPGVQAVASRQPLWCEDLRLLACTAPELTFHGARGDARADLFSVGVLLWEMLAGRALFLGKTAHETIEALRHAPIGRVQRTRFMRGEPLAAMVASVVERALARDADARYQSYGELAVALRDAAPAASTEAVAAYVTDDPSASARASVAASAGRDRHTPVFEDEPPTAEVAPAVFALLGRSESHGEQAPSDPTLEVVVEPALAEPEPTAHDDVVVELDVAPLEPRRRMVRTLVACAILVVVAGAAWALFSSSDAHTTARRASQPHRARASAAQPSALPPIEARAPADSEASTPRESSPQPAELETADGVVPAKATPARPRDTTARKRAPKPFIPEDI